MSRELGDGIENARPSSTVTRSIMSNDMGLVTESGEFSAKGHSALISFLIYFQPISLRDL